MLGLSCCTASLWLRLGVSPVARGWGLLWLQKVGAAAAAPWLSSRTALSCCTTCGILPDQGWNPCLLHWQADAFPLSHQGSPGHISPTASSCCRVFQSVALPHSIHLLPELPTTSHPHKEVCSDCLPPSLPYGPCENLLQILLRVWLAVGHRAPCPHAHQPWTPALCQLLAFSSCLTFPVQPKINK